MNCKQYKSTVSVVIISGAEAIANGSLCDCVGEDIDPMAHYEQATCGKFSTLRKITTKTAPEND